MTQGELDLVHAGAAALVRELCERPSKIMSGQIRGIDARALLFDDIPDRLRREASMREISTFVHRAPGNFRI